MGFNAHLRCPGLDHALVSVPETFPCPFCATEVEIWSDEEKRRCSACKTMVTKKRTQEHGDTGENQHFIVDVLEYTDETGGVVFYERYETDIPLSYFDHDREYKIACETCQKYGKNLACPPFSPTFQDYLGGFKKAKVICVRIPQEYFSHLMPEERYRACFRKGRELLTEELLQFRQRDFRVAGSGACLACPECSAEIGKELCKAPDKRVYSLESLGTNLISLARKSFNISLEWSGSGYFASFACAMGAVFSPKEHDNVTQVRWSVVG